VVHFFRTRCTIHVVKNVPGNYDSMTEYCRYFIADGNHKSSYTKEGYNAFGGIDVVACCRCVMFTRH